MNDLKNLAEQTLAQGNIREFCGEVHFHVFRHRLVGGGVQFNLEYDGWNGKPVVRVMEGTPGKFTIAIVKQEGHSTDYTDSKKFTMEEPLDALYKAFPYEHIRHIVDILLAY